jgi:hypothetical protein
MRKKAGKFKSKRLVVPLLRYKRKDHVQDQGLHIINHLIEVGVEVEIIIEEVKDLNQDHLREEEREIMEIRNQNIMIKRRRDLERDLDLKIKTMEKTRKT